MQRASFRLAKSKLTNGGKRLKQGVGRHGNGHRPPRGQDKRRRQDSSHREASAATQKPKFNGIRLPTGILTPQVLNQTYLELLQAIEAGRQDDVRVLLEMTEQGQKVCVGFVDHHLPVATFILSPPK